MMKPNLLIIVSLILTASIALVVGYRPIECIAFHTQQSISSSRVGKGSSLIRPRLSQSTENNTNHKLDDISSNRIITVSKAIEVPFSAEVAFEKFSDITRQAEFSPWLRKVEYVNPPPDGSSEGVGETKWYMGFRGFSITWNSICTTLEHPNCIEWESTTGMKNYGKVVFTEDAKEQTSMNLTMTFVAPRIASIVLRRSDRIANFVRNRMLRQTLENFRDVVAEEVALSNGRGSCSE